MSSVFCQGLKLVSVLFLGFVLPPLIIFATICICFSFILLLPILCMVYVAALKCKILPRRPIAYAAMSLLNVFLWVLEDWSKKREMILDGMIDNQESVKLNPLEFPLSDESDKEQEENEEREKGGMVSKKEDSESLQALKPAKVELNHMHFYEVLSFWRTKEEEVGKSLKLEKC